MKHRHFIDSHKGATPLAILAMMAWFGAWSNPTAWIYLALHGTYGVLWVMKSRLFGDRQWEQPVRLWFGVGTWAALTGYWIAPFIIVSRGIVAPPWYLGMCAAIYALGVFFHFVSDMQKHVALGLRPGLLTEGLFSLSRNPNYFGELLIYLGFGLLAMHWLPLTYLGLFVLGVWVPNMRKKDRSLSRYPEFAAYRKRTALFIPFAL